MGIARLPMKPTFILRREFVRIRGICTRPLHSSARKEAMDNPRAIPAEWLQRIIKDDSKPPKLYAQRLENLLAENKTRSKATRWPPSKMRAGGRDEDDRRRIYILGVGNIGRLYAMSLSKLANSPPITLVVHRRELLEHWAADPGIELTRDGLTYRNTNFDIEWWTDTAPLEGPAVEVAAGRNIGNLIIATKASDAMPQVDRVRRYLGSHSTVAFAQNGICKLWPPLGNAYVQARFPDGTSPNWIVCVTTHGVTSEGPFKSTHASPAGALVGPVMSSGGDRTGRDDDGAGMETGYLMRQIADAPDLDARLVSRKELWVAQLEKLVVNATINPLTAVLRCQNGELLVARDDDLSLVIDRLLDEAAKVLGALILDAKSEEILLSEFAQQGPVSNDSAVEYLANSQKQLLERFSFPRLRNMFLDVGERVSANTSSMLQDVRSGKATEIDDFNGWLVDTAKLLDQDFRLPTHERLIPIVKAQVQLTRAQLCGSLLG